jgi:hypothetical protein
VSVDDRLLFGLTRSRVEQRVARGDGFAEIERELDGIEALAESERSALWLYAWTLSSRRRGEHGRLAAIGTPAVGEAGSAAPRRRAVVVVLRRAAEVVAAALIAPWPL